MWERAVAMATHRESTPPGVGVSLMVCEGGWKSGGRAFEAFICAGIVEKALQRRWWRKRKDDEVFRGRHNDRKLRRDDYRARSIPLLRLHHMPRCCREPPYIRWGRKCGWEIYISMLAAAEGALSISPRVCVCAPLEKFCLRFYLLRPPAGNPPCECCKKLNGRDAALTTTLAFEGARAAYLCVLRMAWSSLMVQGPERGNL